MGRHGLDWYASRTRQVADSCDWVNELFFWFYNVRENLLIVKELLDSQEALCCMELVSLIGWLVGWLVGNGKVPCLVICYFCSDYLPGRRLDPAATSSPLKMTLYFDTYIGHTTLSCEYRMLIFVFIYAAMKTKTLFQLKCCQIHSHSFLFTAFVSGPCWPG